MNALGAFYCPHTFIAVKAATAVADVGGAAVGEIRVAQQAAADLHKVKAGLHKLREIIVAVGAPDIDRLTLHRLADMLGLIDFVSFFYCFSSSINRNFWIVKNWKIL